MFDTVIDSAIIGLIGIIFGAFLAYLFGTYKESKQKILSERIALYRPVANCLEDILWLDDTNPEEHKMKMQELEIKINRLSNELLLFAPDDVYEKFLKTVNFKKGDSGEKLEEFLLFLRKKLIGKTKVKKGETYHIKFTP